MEIKIHKPEVAVQISCLETYSEPYEKVSPFLVESYEKNMEDFKQLSKQLSSFAAGLMMPSYEGKKSVSEFLKDQKFFWVASLCLNIPIGLCQRIAFLFNDWDACKQSYLQIAKKFMQEKVEGSFFEMHPETFAAVYGNRVLVQIPYSFTRSTRGANDTFENALKNINPFSKRAVQAMPPTRMLEEAHMLTHSNGLQDVFVKTDAYSQWISAEPIEALLKEVRGRNIFFEIKEVSKDNYACFLTLNSIFDVSDSPSRYCQQNKTQKFQLGKAFCQQDLKNNQFENVGEFEKWMSMLLMSCFDTQQSKSLSQEETFYRNICLQKPEFKSSL